MKWREGVSLAGIYSNHEQMMLDAPISKIKMQHWLKNGGSATLKSFHIESLKEIATKYLSFLKKTKFYIKTQKYIFVHAGLNFSKANLFEDKDAMLWLRDFPSYQPVLAGQILIHGHTPKSLDTILTQHGNCFNIDGGCVFKEHSHLGKMVAINLIERKFISINNCD